MTDPASHLAAALADRYKIERELGQGGMATVYLAHDVRHDRKVALKVLRPELAAVIGAERFLAEIKTTANLQHPHILPLFDSGRTGEDERWREDFVFYVMPFVEGESLRDRLNREHQLPVDEAVRIAREVADALDYAHRHGVVHRDIKPENILLHDGRAQVADFGIALAVSRSDGGTRMTETGMSLGTPHYMAPEQAMGEREITPKADVYALGCVLYEMLAGEPPFAGPTAQAIIARVMTEEPRSLTVQRRTIPPHVEAAVITALAKLPADRFPTAAAFSEALGKTDFTLATRVAPAAATAPVMRRGLVIQALPWAFLAAAIAVAVAGWLRRTPPVVTRQRIVLWNHPVAPGFLHAGLAIAPDGATTVFVDTVGGTRQLWAKERDEIETKPLTGTTGASGPTFSPDGQWIAFAADGKLKKVPRLGGSAIALADSATEDYPDIAWLEDGTITFANPRYALLAVPQDGGPVRVLVNAENTVQWGVVSASPLPEGRGVLIGTCTPGCLDMNLRALDLRSGQQHVLGESIIKGWYVPGGNVVFVRQDGGVFSAPFDLSTLAFRKAPVPVFQGVRSGYARADMALSPSGTLIYAVGAATSSGTPARAMWVDRSGTATPVDTAWPPFVPASYPGLALSPDGRRLAVDIQNGATADIWIKQLDAGPLTRLTFAGNNNVPEWTADGRTVMYIAGLGSSNGGGDVHARRADGTGAEETLVDVQRQIVDVVRTPDTARLILRVTLPPSRDIMLWHRGDTALTPLLAESYQEIEPALSPDGRWLAYNSDESGRTEIYVRPFPTVTGGRWQVSRNGGTEPLWSHSGRELFYRDAQGGLVAVSVRPGPSFDVGEQRTLFSASNYLIAQGRRMYDITPDDRRFVFLRSVGEAQSAAGPVNLVQVDNWFEELRGGRGRR
jgi:eukaryotic-like serine/threonine-protein kinase